MNLPLDPSRRRKTDAFDKDPPMTLAPLIEAAYAAAHHPLRWEDFLDALLEHAGFGAAAVGYRPNVHDPFINGFLRGPDEAQVEAFFARAIPDDPLAPLSSTAPMGAFLVHGNAVVKPEVFAASGYHQWMAQNQYTDVLIAGHRLEDDAMVLVTLFCTSEANLDEQKALLEAIAPHVCRALVLCQEYVELTRRYRQALAAIEHTRFGCALLGRRGEVEWMNERGRRLLEQAGWVRFEPSARLDEALFQALGATRAEKSTTRTSLEAEATSNLGGYEVRLVPLQTMGNPFGHRGSSSALLFIADPDNLDIEIDAHIQTLYGLTEAEARVARHIVSGYSVDNIAAILSRSTNTIRAQLKSAMRKCQVSSQAQLVGLIHRGLAVSA